jgi:ribosomal protein L11 methyltransferase
VLWFEITAVVGARAEVEGVAEVMRGVAPGGVTVEEPVDILGPEEGFRVRPGEAVLVRAYLPSSELGAILVEQLRTRMHEAFPAVELVAKPLYEEDWAVSWREFFGVVDYGGRIVIVPSWLADEAPPGRLAIRLDPGQAFGTGHHETTRLCLAALEGCVRPGVRVLDVGTGSGVLAIASVLLGAGEVEAVDVDPVAAEVARANCAANGVAGRVRVRAGTLDEGAGGGFDVVVANISAAANAALAGAFARATAPGGRLVLSGLLTSDRARVTEAMTAAGFALEAVRVERDWCLGEFRRDEG